MFDFIRRLCRRQRRTSAEKDEVLEELLSENSRLIDAAKRQNILIKKVAKVGLVDDGTERSPDERL